MKQLIFTILLLLPLTCFAQKKQSWRARAEQRRAAEKAEYQKPVIFKNKLDEGGFHIQKAGSFLIGGSVCELIGGGLLGASDGNAPAEIAGGVMAGAGIILQIVGYCQIQKGGRLIRGLTFTGNGLSYSF